MHFTYTLHLTNFEVTCWIFVVLNCQEKILFTKSSSRCLIMKRTPTLMRQDTTIHALYQRVSDQNSRVTKEESSQSHGRKPRTSLCEFLLCVACCVISVGDIVIFRACSLVFKG